MAFDLSTALAVREREDGLLEKDIFDLSTAVPVEDNVKSGMMQKVISNPAVSKMIDTVTGGLSVEEGNKMLESIVGPLADIAPILTEGGVMPTPEKIGKGTVKLAQFVLSAMARPVTAAQAGIGAIVDKKPTGEIIQSVFKGYLKPEEVKSLTSKVPFQEWEQGAWPTLIPRATTEAIETYLISNLVYGNVAGKIKKAYESYKIEGVAQELNKITTNAAKEIIKDPEKFKINFPKDWNEADKLGMTKAYLQNRLGSIPKVGDVLMERQSFMNKLKTTLQSERGSIQIPKVGSTVDWKGQIGTIKEITGERVIIQLGKSEVVATLSQLSLPEVKPTEGKVEGKTYYHGTYSKFKEFMTPQEMPEEIANEVLGKPSNTFGIYFTPSKELAGEFGDKIIEANLKIDKPLDLRGVKTFEELVAKLPIDIKAGYNANTLRNIKSDSRFDDDYFTDDVYRALEMLVNKFDLLPKIKAGKYDSIIFNDRENGIKGETVIVFDKSQVKLSPTGEGQNKIETVTFTQKDGSSPESISYDYSTQEKIYKGERQPLSIEEWEKQKAASLAHAKKEKWQVKITFGEGQKPPVEPPITTEGITPQPSGDPIQKVIQALKEAKPIRAEQEALMKAERGRRIAQAKAMGQEISGEAGFYAQLGSLKGELPKAQFETLRGKITQEDIDFLFDKIRTSEINDWNKIGAQTGLAKLFGEFGGQVPTEGELKILHTIFGKEFTDALLDNRTLMQKFIYATGQILNIPRSVMASFDLSAPLRQGAFMIGRPKQFIPAFGEMFKFFASEKVLAESTKDISSRPTYGLMREHGLSLMDLGTALTTREEKFMSNWAEKIPIAGKVIRASSRAYTGFLNKLRADVFDDLYNKAKSLGIEENDKFLNDLVEFINTATGRGKLPGKLENAAVALNSIFFSPRLMASRINLLNPLFYTSKDPFVRKEALKSLLTFAGIGLTILTLAMLGGAEVSSDMRSSDGGKIKIDNTRVDIWAGFQQYFRMATQLITGEYVSSVTGKIITLGEGYKPITRFDILLRQLENKEAPVASFITALLRQQTFMGEDVNVLKEIGQRFTPMVLSDLVEIATTNPSLLPLGVLGLFGVGIQTYENKLRSSSTRSSAVKQRRTSSTK